MVWLTKILCKSPIVFDRHRQFYCLHKTNDIYKDIVEDVDIMIRSSNYESNGPLPKVKSKKVIGWMEDELGGKLMKKYVGLRERTYNYLIDDNS